MEIPDEVKRCVECIKPNLRLNHQYDYENGPMEVSSRIHKAFIDDCEDGFESGICNTCTNGLVPYHLPTSQVIRFIKNIFTKHNLQL